ncbi:MAG: anaerobic ribonucleoside-triphosphate reductase activating protein [Candidatus Omnitrophica bacterium]|nr:anaerobic ribonucleoside-triphosphate reductase activating protein [Candidatus Omnitrophota bacterium]
MKIAGLQKISMVDYPGYICATVFTQGCNFRCGFCHNRDLMTTEADFGFSEEDLFELLRERKNILEALCVTGGEPTLWSDLPDFAEKVKTTGVKLKLDTNGSNPDMIRLLLQRGLVDFIAMDVKTSFGKYHLFNVPEGTEELLELSIERIMRSSVPYEFRTTCVPGIVTGEDIHSIGKAIKGAEKYCLQQFRPHENVLDKEFAHMRPYGKDALCAFRAISEAYVEKAVTRGI